MKYIHFIACSLMICMKYCVSFMVEIIDSLLLRLFLKDSLIKGTVQLQTNMFIQMVNGIKL